MIKSIKFGGTSMGSAESILKCVSIIKSKLNQRDNIVITVSAVGGVTNKLLSIIQGKYDIKNIKDSINNLSGTHVHILNAIISDKKTQKDIWNKSFASIFHEIELICVENDKITDKLTAQICSYGEKLSSLLIFYALSKKGVKCCTVASGKMIKTNDNYLDASVNFGTTNTLVNHEIRDLFSNNTIPIITGFIGQNSRGDTTLLGRGGSDYTAAVMAYALQAEVLEIWTDVDGVMSTDPNICSKAYSLKQLDSKLMLEMSCNGAKVLDYKSVLLALKRNISIYIYNTFNQEFEGSCISNSAKIDEKKIVSITSSPKKTIVHLELPQSITKIKSILTKHNITTKFSISSESGMYFTLENNQCSEKIQKELDELSNLSSYQDEVIQICIIGDKIGNNSGIIENVFNIINSLEICLYLTHITPNNISIFVNYKNKKTVIQQLHNFLEKNNAIN